jgi:hypothetical protein
MGTSGPPYTIQSEAENIFHSDLLPDTRLHLSTGLKDVVSRMKFDDTTNKESFVATPVKMSESITLWALGTTISNLICKERYGIDQESVINSDIANLFICQGE